MKIIVKIEEDHLIGFFPEILGTNDPNTFEGFAFQEGHNYAHLDYINSLKNPSKKRAQEFVKELEEYYNSLSEDAIKLELIDKV